MSTRTISARFLGLLLAAATLLAACSAPTESRNASADAVPTEQLERTLQKWAARDDVPGTIARIDVPANGFSWSGAAGTTEMDGHEQLTVDHPFRIASVTKTVTSAVVLRLAEQGVIDLDATIDTYLGSGLVDRVHVDGDVSRGREVTVRQLLANRSGIHDYATDPAFIPQVLDDPGRTWAPEELIDYAVSHGTPHFPPGQGYHYSDTGYALLGLIIEDATSQPLHEIYRSHVFEPLGMDSTYLEGHEPSRGLPLSHPYLGTFDGLEVHPSVSFAGGGLVSTAQDLTTFMIALTNGELFETSQSLDEMTALDVTERGSGFDLLYGLGYLGLRSGDFEMGGHDGFWGAFMYHAPAYGLYITGTINQAEVSQLDLIVDLLEVLEA